MIPRVLISCWFGGGEKSDLFKRCAESKRKVLADWEHVEVTEDSAPELMSIPHVKALHDRKQFASMPELARIWALRHYGGVYLDEDVEVLKPLDPLLDDDFFIGYEDGNTLCGAVMGSVAGGSVIEHMWNVFPKDGDASLKPTFYTPGRWLEGIHCTKYPPAYFYPYLYNEKPSDARITPNTYCSHHWASSWQDYTWRGK